MSSLATVKRNVAIMSSGSCPLDNCNIKIIQKIGDKQNNIGKFAHIRAQKPGGPRYDVKMTDEERDSEDNIILLCANCHDKIDKFAEEYTVEKLQALKKAIEKKYYAQKEENLFKITNIDLFNAVSAIASVEAQLEQGFDRVRLEEKIKINNLGPKPRMHIKLGMFMINKVKKFIDKRSIEKAEYGYMLKQGFLKEYYSLQNQFSGDDLFFEILKYVEQGSDDRVYQAAALALLVYMFEVCEVFDR